MAQIDQVCSTCSAPITTVFDPGSGTRASEVIAGDLVTKERCFVRDTITFFNSGRLIFAPNNKEYAETYSVVCRKLVIIGGGKPGDAPPCEAGDVGSTYSAKNVITWQDRLHRAANGPAQLQAATGESFDPNQWEDKGQGNAGKDGGRGADGNPGNHGDKGRDAPRIINIVALEVVIGANDHLIVDWHGQDGGNGGAGQRAGDGGRGMGGRDGEVDASWTGDSCGREPGNGGNGGDGGNGGKGGDGGDGGNGGLIFIISTPANISSSGPFKSGRVHYVYDGPNYGTAGDGGRGGRGATQFGHAGNKTSECEAAEAGQPGINGFPDPLGTGGTTPGADGTSGEHGDRKFESIAPPSSGSCADIVPLPFRITAIAPNTGARNSSVAVTITGIGFKPAAAIHNVDVSGIGVTVNSIAAASDTSITCSFDIAVTATQTVRDVTVTVDADSVKKVGGFTVT